MKIRIETDPSITEDEVIIRCGKISDSILKMEHALNDLCISDTNFIFYKGDTEFYLPLDSILFFETEDNQVFAHTKKDVYQTKYRLYELEELLPGFFIRVSKSTILNVSHVLSIKKNLTASSEVWFEGTHKQVYVSRNYNKQLKQRLEEKRLKR